MFIVYISFNIFGFILAYKKLILYNIAIYISIQKFKSNITRYTNNLVLKLSVKYKLVNLVLNISTFLKYIDY